MSNFGSDFDDLDLDAKNTQSYLRGISKENTIDQEGLTWSPFCCWTSGGTVATFKGWLTGGPLHKSQVRSPYQFYSVQSRIRVKSAVKSNHGLLCSRCSNVLGPPNVTHQSIETHAWTLGKNIGLKYSHAWTNEKLLCGKKHMTNNSV